MIRADSDITALLQDFFAGEVTPELVAETERTGAWPADLWQRASRVEIPRIGVAEESGGVGGTLADVAELLHHAGYHATPLPLLEHHLASHLLAVAGLDPVDGPLSVAGLGPGEVPVVEGGALTGRLDGVPWAADVSAVAVLTTDDGRDVVALVDPSAATIEQHVDLAGTPVPTLVLDAVPVQVAALPGVHDVLRRAEVLRCARTAGVLARLYDLTAAYVAERHQFGKPVGAFQAVQIHVVTLAQAATTSRLAVERAVSAVAEGVGGFEVQAASVVVAEHAVAAAAAAHQAHGAIGMTREYPLQQLTRRLHAWRQSGGSLTSAQRDVGEIALAAPRLSELVARHPDEGVPA